MHISSSYAKILGEKLFRTWEFLRSGSKAKHGGEKKRERKRERAKVGDNNGQAMHGARKPPGPKEERLNDFDNNGQATHGARKHAWRTLAAWANAYIITMLCRLCLLINNLC